jgi:hypothetical protein
MRSEREGKEVRKSDVEFGGEGGVKRDGNCDVKKLHPSTTLN